MKLLHLALLVRLATCTTDFVASDTVTDGVDSEMETMPTDVAVSETATDTVDTAVSTADSAVDTVDSVSSVVDTPVDSSTDVFVLSVEPFAESLESVLASVTELLTGLSVTTPPISSEILSLPVSFICSGPDEDITCGPGLTLTDSVIYTEECKGGGTTSCALGQFATQVCVPTGSATPTCDELEWTVLTIHLLCTDASGSDCPDLPQYTTVCSGESPDPSITCGPGLTLLGIMSVSSCDSASIGQCGLGITLVCVPVDNEPNCPELERVTTMVPWSCASDLICPEVLTTATVCITDIMECNDGATPSPVVVTQSSCSAVESGCDWVASPTTVWECPVDKITCPTGEPLTTVVTITNEEEDCVYQYTTTYCPKETTCENGQSLITSTVTCNLCSDNLCTDTVTVVTTCEEQHVCETGTPSTSWYYPPCIGPPGIMCTAVLTLTVFCPDAPVLCPTGTATTEVVTVTSCAQPSDSSDCVTTATTVTSCPPALPLVCLNGDAPTTRWYDRPCPTNNAFCEKECVPIVECPNGGCSSGSPVTSTVTTSLCGCFGCWEQQQVVVGCPTDPLVCRCGLLRTTLVLSTAGTTVTTVICTSITTITPVNPPVQPPTGPVIVPKGSSTITVILGEALWTTETVTVTLCKSVTACNVRRVTTTYCPATVVGTGPGGTTPGKAAATGTGGTAKTGTVSGTKTGSGSTSKGSSSLKGVGNSNLASLGATVVGLIAFVLL